MFNLQAVIVEGILNGDIPFLLTYMEKRYGNHKATHAHIIDAGLMETVVFLREKEISNAKNMIENMVISNHYL